MRMKQRFAVCLFGPAIGLVATPVSGATASTSFSVSATVLAPACAASVSPLQSGHAGEQRDRPEVLVRCAHPVPYTVSIEDGQSGLSNTASRQLGTGPASIERGSRSNVHSAGQSYMGGAGAIDGFDFRSVSNWHTTKQSAIAEEASSGTIVVSVDY